MKMISKQQYRSTEMKKKLAELAPPGSNAKTAVSLFVSAIIVMVLASLTCPTKIISENKDLFFRYGYYFDAGFRLSGFGYYTRGSMFFFWVILLFAIAFGIANYMSFYRETKSIYVMKRIPDGGEMFRRCFAIPLMAVALALVIAIILLIIYSMVYRYVPPADRIDPVLFTDFLRAFTIF